jgi:hypothetical protein
MKKIYKTKNARKTLKKIKILDKVSQNGKIFGVEFIKKDGSKRLMSCRKGVKRYLKGGINTCSHIPKYLTVFSVNDKGYRNISIPGIRKIKGCGQTFTF